MNSWEEGLSEEQIEDASYQKIKSLEVSGGFPDGMKEKCCL